MDEPGRRYDPVGSSNECDSNVELVEHEHCHCLESEQEKLSTSLQALTSHFAQVQFRLRQIISAPEEEKFNLIESLDEFASRGICDDKDDGMLSAMNRQQVSQFKLIDKLQVELSAASNYNLENEEEFDDVETETNSEALIGNDEVAVDSTDASVSHLKTQICDLDTCVSDLRYETINLKHMTRAMVGYRTCDEVYGNVHHSTKSTCQSLCDVEDNGFTEYDDFMSASLHKKPLSTLQRYEQSLQGPLTQSKSPTTNPIKCSSPKVFHRGHIQAKLKIDVQNIISVVSIDTLDIRQFERPNGIKLQKEITKMVRKELCGTLRELIEHGLHSRGNEFNFLRCCIRRAEKGKTSSNDSQLNSKHAWDIIMEYYNLNDGNERYRRPCNTLNESFRLSMASVKDQLLRAIGDVVNTHVRYNTSQNSYFKAFVLLGLNLRKLPHWLNMIFKCSDLIEANYSNESLVRQPEFADILECLDSLSQYELNLPVDTLADRFNKIGKEEYF